MLGRVGERLLLMVAWARRDEFWVCLMQNRGADSGMAVVVERSFAWTARFRRLARGYERLAATLKGLHLLAFTVIMLRRFVTLMAAYA